METPILSRPDAGFLSGVLLLNLPLAAQVKSAGCQIVGQTSRSASTGTIPAIQFVLGRQCFTYALCRPHINKQLPFTVKAHFTCHKRKYA
jgi:hypothetical protein